MKPATVFEVQQWREADLSMALRLMAGLLTEEQRAEFWRRYHRHAALLPPPPGVVILNETPPPRTGRN